MSNEKQTASENKLTRATVVYLVDTDGKVCLAQMKKAIHKDEVHGGEQIEYSLGVWNGYGGKEEESDRKYCEQNGINNSMLYTAIRELEEESGVKAVMEDLEERGAVNFYLREKSDLPFMQVHFYILHKWGGQPIEGKEMGAPTFFDKENIPYEQMMPADKILFERLLVGERIDSDVILIGKGIEPIVQFML